MLSLCVGFSIFLYWLYAQVAHQGLDAKFWRDFKLAKVVFDDNGIPTLSHQNWEGLIKAQGYVVASERMWQMDLLRRKASGSLSPWFGAKTVKADLEKLREQRRQVAQRAVTTIDPNDRRFCELYAEGVNQFINEHSRKWGAEYNILQVTPEPWRCEDSLLIVMEMADLLTSSYKKEANEAAWREHIPESWYQFLFPQNHPWNQPMFGQKLVDGPSLPDSKHWLQKEHIEDQEELAQLVENPSVLGSNNWAYRGKKGDFLANDPHLKHMVPGIWFAQRLRVSASDWVVGVGIPGVPGVVLGMNPHLAWAFTNTGEDVDDLIEEELSKDGAYYADFNAQDEKVWLPIEKRQVRLAVRGEEQERSYVLNYTKRGALLDFKELPGRHYSRQWLALFKGKLSLPTVSIMRASTLASIDRAIDQMTIPGQNIVVMNRKSEILYRASGTGVLKKHQSNTPETVSLGAWQGFEPAQKRKRRLLEKGYGFLATANERIWMGGRHHWSSDDRKRRIVEVLSSSDAFDFHDMEKLQLDTVSHFRQIILTWIANHHNGVPLEAQSYVQSWRTWDGSSESNSLAFYQARLAEMTLQKLLIRRIAKAYLPKGMELGYKKRLKRAWLLEVMNNKDGLEAFGLSSAEVASYLLSKIVEAGPLEHETQNKWRVQHPFVGRVPFIGQLFAIDEYEQKGDYDVISAEKPDMGPSVRLVWNLSDPMKSSWILPVGQSGHISSDHYSSMQSLWHSDQRLQVFADGEAWEFL